MIRPLPTSDLRLNFDGPRPTSQTRSRDVGFILLLTLSLLVFRAALVSVVHLALNDDRYSYVLVVPFVTALLICWKRAEVFRETEFSPIVGAPPLLIGIGLFAGNTSLWGSAQPGIILSVAILSVTMVWIGAFALCYGPQAVKAAAFPLMFLVFTTPLSAGLMDQATVALQRGSAEISYWLFKLVQIPFLREGFRFSLPGIDIEIAEECSGIRSSLSLFLASILISHLALRSHWGKMSFILTTIPIVIFKNAVRIVTISWLGIYVDRGFFYGNLHRRGGLPFGLLAFGIMFCVLVLMQKAEGKLRGHAKA
jgi:exosortase